MESPKDITLPFFAYGIFKPGQLGYHSLRELVAEARTECEIKGALLLRDGLPIIDPNPGYSSVCNGTSLIFKPHVFEEAYQRIAQIEPDKHYLWGVTRILDMNVNVLYGRSPKKGSVPFEDAEWDGRNDPLFTEALDVVEETLKENMVSNLDLKPLFRLQMAYLLLWTSIERYVSLRYHLGKKVMEKVNNIAGEAAFTEALKQFVNDEREVSRCDDPGDNQTLDSNDPKKSLNYYYQIRSNITHRGKGVMRDHDIIRNSLEELLNIFRHVLQVAFAESKAT